MTIVSNASGAAAVNIQDGGNSITVDGNITVSGGGVGSPYAPYANTIQGTIPVIADTLSHTLIAAAGAGIRTYITSLNIGNGSGAEGTVTIRDGVTAVQAYRVHNDESQQMIFPHPLRGSANTAWNIQSDNTLSLTVCYAGFTSIN